MKDRYTVTFVPSTNDWVVWDIIFRSTVCVCFCKDTAEYICNLMNYEYHRGE